MPDIVARAPLVQGPSVSVQTDAREVDLLLLQPFNAGPDAVLYRAYFGPLPRVVEEVDDTFQATASADGMSTAAATFAATAEASTTVAGTSTSASTFQVTADASTTVAGVATAASSIAAIVDATTTVAGTSTAASTFEATAAASTTVAGVATATSSLEATATASSTVAGTSTAASSVRAIYSAVGTAAGTSTTEASSGTIFVVASVGRAFARAIIQNYVPVVQIHGNVTSTPRRVPGFYVEQDNEMRGPLTWKQADTYARKVSSDPRLSPTRYATFSDENGVVQAFYVNGVKVAGGKVARARARQV